MNLTHLQLSTIATLIDGLIEINGVNHVKFKNGVLMALPIDNKNQDEWAVDWNSLESHYRTSSFDSESNAIMILRDLMNQDCVNGDWKPDWNDDSEKWVIEFWENRLNVYCHNVSAHFLAFKDDSTARKFISMYKKYIEKAAPVLFGVKL